MASRRARHPQRNSALVSQRAAGCAKVSVQFVAAWRQSTWVQPGGVFDRNGISYPTVVLHRDLGFPAAASMLPGAMVVGRIYFEVPVAATLIALQWNWYPDRFVTQIDLGL